MINQIKLLDNDSLFSFHTMELKKQVLFGEYRRIRDYLYSGGGRVPPKNGMLEGEEFKGIGVRIYIPEEFSMNSYAALRINPRKVLRDYHHYGIFEPSEKNVKELIDSISNTLKTSKIGEIGECKLKRLDFCKNVEMETSVADDYINLINRACPSYSFRKELYIKDGKKEKDGIYFRSNLLEIYIYHKAKQLKNIGEIDELPSDSAVLRFEVRFDRKKIRDLEKMSGADSLETLLINIANYSKNNFTYYIPRLFFRGKYRRYADGIDLINQSRFQERTKEMMLNLYEEASKKHDLQTAIMCFSEYSGADIRKVSTLLRNFDEIDLNPIPLNQRCSSRETSLKSIPELLGLKEGSITLPSCEII